MSTSGGVNSIVTPPYTLPLGSWFQPVLGPAATPIPVTAQLFRGLPFWLPVSITVKSLGIVVSAAGDATCTVTPFIAGNPTSALAWTPQVWTGPLATTSVGTVSGAVTSGGPLTPGWYMAGVVGPPSLVTAATLSAIYPGGGGNATYAPYTISASTALPSVSGFGGAVSSGMPTPPPSVFHVVYTGSAAYAVAIGL